MIIEYELPFSSTRPFVGTDKPDLGKSCPFPFRTTNDLRQSSSYLFKHQACQPAKLLYHRPASESSTMHANEDFIYRTSSQYRNWSFTPAQLAEQRQRTNLQATERVKANVARQRADRNRQLDTASASETERGNGSGLDTGSSTPIPLDREVNCLTVAEEKRLLDYFCAQAQSLGNFLKFPIEVTVRIPKHRFESYRTTWGKDLANN